jgi:hypothetical protein
MPVQLSLLQKLALIFLVSLCFSCNQNGPKKTIATFRFLDDGLIASNNIVRDANNEIMMKLKNRATDPMFVSKTTIWLPKATSIHDQSKKLLLFIDQLRTLLQNEAGVFPGKKVIVYNGDNMDAPVRLFSQQKKGEELYNNLKEYKSNVLNVDPAMSIEFNDKLVILSDPFDNKPSSPEEFTKAVFAHTPTQSALAILSRFQNNILLAENKLLTYCELHTDMIIESFEVFRFIATINSSFVKAGQQIEVYAGVGAFSNTAKADIIINGKKAPVEADGVATYKLRAPDQPGEHEIIVKVEYFNPAGERRTAMKTLRYTVAN